MECFKQKNHTKKGSVFTQLDKNPTAKSALNSSLRTNRQADMSSTRLNIESS
jgi:hypothetical protein